MAKNRDWHFSESDSLNARDLGASPPEREERIPIWAQVIEEKKAEKASASFAAPENDEKDDAPAPEDLDEPNAPEETDAPNTSGKSDVSEEPEEEEDENGVRSYVFQSARREEAQEAWNREAQRVEGGQNTRRRPGEDEDGPNRKKGKPGKGKKGSGRKKKNQSKAEERRGFVKLIAIILVCGALFLMVAMMVMSNFISYPLLTLPRQIITTLMTPLQTAFSGVTDSVASWVRVLKIRGNIEYEYEQLLIQLDDMANETAINEELRRENQALRDELEEHQRNLDMNPLFAQVIGTVGNNYFSTLTLNVGAADGVADYMAVVDNGGLVGVTYDTKENSCSVRCIIDSDCTVAGLVQSSRDQGSVKGTLGTNGEPMCRMYYLPDNSLPRPNDVVVTSGVGLEFPKGIPIGYIRESTRGMEDNKSYVVLEPVVDFQHLEYVTVYRYRPSYAEDAQARTNSSQTIKLETLATARPVPSFQMEGLSDFVYSATATPDTAAAASPAPTPAATDTPVPSATPDPNATKVPANLEYHPADLSGATATPSPRPTFTPTPSPAPTPDAGAMTVEDDE